MHGFLGVLLPPPTTVENLTVRNVEVHSDRVIVLYDRVGPTMGGDGSLFYGSSSPVIELEDSSGTTYQKHGGGGHGSDAGQLRCEAVFTPGPPAEASALRLRIGPEVIELDLADVVQPPAP